MERGVAMLTYSFLSLAKLFWKRLVDCLAHPKLKAIILSNMSLRSKIEVDAQGVKSLNSFLLLRSDECPHILLRGASLQ